MKKLLMSVGVLLCLNANAQWTNKNVNNDFDIFLYERWILLR